MPLPLIPIILGGASVVAGLVGIGKGIEASEDMENAKDITNHAKRIVNDAEKSIVTAQEKTKNTIISLGTRKVEVLSNSINKFVINFEKIKDIDLKNSKGIDELRNLNLEKEEFNQLKRASFEAVDVAVNGIASVAAGSLLAYGTYSVVMGGLGGVLVTATTGTALSTLAGAAATNATLAWLGGGALAAGGLGMAGGEQY